MLYATQVFLEENNPKKLNPIIGELKDAITKGQCAVKTKGKNLIHRQNCIQYWGITNDLSTIDFSTTVRQFLAVKVKSDLIKGLIDDLDSYWIENFGYRFWEFGYEMVLKNEFCLKWILLDIRDGYETEGTEDIDFQKTMLVCDHMKHAVKRNIKSIYPFLQKICSDATEKLNSYEFDTKENDNINSFERWYYYDNHYQHDDRNIFKPLTTHLAKQKNFIGG